LPDLVVLAGDLPLDDSLEVDDFCDGSDSLVLLLLVFLPWLGPAEGSSSSRSIFLRIFIVKISSYPGLVQLDHL
ncbi:hypothetical protein Tco_0443964, partial [Tanacetum coccineum]